MLQAKVLFSRDGRFLAAATNSDFSAPGRFAVEGLEAGPVDVWVSATQRVSRWIRAEVQPDATTLLPDQRLEAGVTLRARVLGWERPADVTFRYAEVCALRSDLRLPDRQRVRVDEAGRFEFAGLSPGTWTVTGFDFKYPWTSTPWALETGPLIEIPADRDAVDLEATLVRGASLHILPKRGEFPGDWRDRREVSPAQQRLADGCRVQVLAADGAVVVDHTGGFQGPRWPFRGLHLRPARYVVRAQLPGGIVHELAVDLAAGDQVDLDLSLDRLTRRGE